MFNSSGRELLLPLCIHLICVLSKNSVIQLFAMTCGTIREALVSGLLAVNLPGSIAAGADLIIEIQGDP
jgi:hypothetical protein